MTEFFRGPLVSSVLGTKLGEAGRPPSRRAACLSWGVSQKRSSGALWSPQLKPATGSGRVVFDEPPRFCFSHRRDLLAGGRIRQETAEAHSVHPRKQLSEVSRRDRNRQHLGASGANRPTSCPRRVDRGGRGLSSRGVGPCRGL